ncbi:Rqc2 family fibronectin-binding protein [Desulforamulus ruminis]|uniref:Rqc2 homolog RqcH n=1 Tax=Desulforamulus ruminis (strain ATCC 23193 / DSM 2154 / NCIMB 8452 / DL) TaxID=696281 RepID=F6DMA7_DESRL|nr:NFACT RNA binding domain-containing protein [Desulforamulus ruminis]AEG60574.1 Fibronectin-binding A domain protein [Desulforamulus ruminis DSM 2154]
MAFDGLVMAAVASELAGKIVGGRLEKIHQPGPSELVLVIHTRDWGKQRLLISAEARDARVHLTDGAYVNPLAPPVFCMVLRKHLEGGRIRSVEQVGLERVLKLSFDSRDELGRPGSKLLFCEVMGKHSNVLLVDPGSNTIVDGIHRYSHSVSRYREVLPNRPYLPPPEQGKKDPRQLSEEQFRSVILNSDLGSTLTEVLLQNIAGIGPQTCRELVVRAGLPQDYQLEYCGEYELNQLWAQLQKLRQTLEQGTFAPTLLLDRRGQPLDFAALDLSHLPAFRRESGEMNRLLDRYYGNLKQRRVMESRRQSLLQITRREIARFKKKLALYQKSLAAAEKGDDYRLFGELLTANLYRLEQGSEARVENFYHPENQELLVPLDPTLTPGENAQAYFKKYLKAKNTREAVLAHLELAQAEVSYLEAVEIAVSQALDPEDLQEIRTELEEQAYLKARTQQGQKKSKKEQGRSTPLSFVSSEGLTILVGKNNKQNDYLTLKLAGDEDIWLHTKDIPGSHVIIRLDRHPEVPEQTLLEAASLAAWFSKARQSGKVPVDYTRRRHVRKPKGAKPGMVIYDNQRTLMAAPNEELVERLMPAD